MRVALNLLYLIPGVVGGTETYARGLIRGLAALDASTEYLLFVNREAADAAFTDAPNFRRVVCAVRATRRPARYAWEQLVLPWQLARHRVDLVHSLGYVGPFVPPCPHVLTIPDLNYVGHPAMSAVRRRLLRFFVETTAARAKSIVTLSHFSRREIEARLGLPAGSVTVTHLASDATRGASGTGPSIDLRRRYGLDRPYVVAFSSSSRHKNIPRLLEAFGAVASGVPHMLLLIGHPHPDTLAACDAVPQLRGRVLSTGFVPDTDVWPLLSGATLMVAPSLYEGFGLPVLDAQKLGVPVAASDAGSLPEVGGDGAVYFDPRCVPDMAGAIRRCLHDEALRRDLTARGLRNAARFSWAQTARVTREVYDHSCPAGRGTPPTSACQVGA